MIEVLLSKIRHATITSANIDYKGSIVLDPEFMDMADMYPYQRVDINCKDNGARFNTYILAGERGKGQVEINGAAARMVEAGMTIHINAYGMVDGRSEIKPKIIERIN